jgi:hypothetical protein
VGTTKDNKKALRKRGKRKSVVGWLVFVELLAALLSEGRDNTQNFWLAGGAGEESKK